MGSFVASLGLLCMLTDSWGPGGPWVSQWPHCPQRLELGWLEEVVWSGFSLHIAFHLMLLHSMVAREGISGGVTFELWSAKG